jgi:hypothetical protein
MEKALVLALFFVRLLREGRIEHMVRPHSAVDRLGSASLSGVRWDRRDTAPAPSRSYR